MHDNIVSIVIKNIKLNHRSLYRLLVVSMLLVDFEFS